MTPAGWIIMIVSVFGMTGLFAWCIRKVLTIPEAAEHLHSQSDIDPHDQE
ncbi:MAG: hypothetical protein JXR25_06670 [Pontiellaceae bacterium]|nr:hypothetical protein [Pontiellaceae bacterium]MBN2784493.1 hypothetical protein [Pontiellaceae bacterium]